MTGVHANLYVVTDDSQQDASSKKVLASIFRILEFKPDDKGNPGKPVFESAPFERQTFLSMTADEASGIIYFSSTRR